MTFVPLAIVSCLMALRGVFSFYSLSVSRVFSSLVRFIALVIAVRYIARVIVVRFIAPVIAVRYIALVIVACFIAPVIAVRFIALVIVVRFIAPVIAVRFIALATVTLYSLLYCCQQHLLFLLPRGGLLLLSHIFLLFLTYSPWI